MDSSSRCIELPTRFSILASSPSFLDTYSLSTSSLVCNSSCMILIFLVLWSICLSSSVHFKKGPENITRALAQEFIPLIRLMLDSFVSNSFPVLLRSSFWIFPVISTCLMLSASKIPKYLQLSFSPSVLILSWFIVPFRPSDIVLLREFFYTTVSWWAYTGFWVTLNLFKSQELLCVLLLLLLQFFFTPFLSWWSFTEV